MWFFELLFIFMGAFYIISTRNYCKNMMNKYENNLKLHIHFDNRLNDLENRLNDLENEMRKLYIFVNEKQ